MNCKLLLVLLALSWLLGQRPASAQYYPAPNYGAPAGGMVPPQSAQPPYAPPPQTTWSPQSAPSYDAAYPQTAGYGPLPQMLPPVELFEPARIVARVGDQEILAGDALPMVNQMLKSAAGKVPPAEIEAQREQLLEMVVEQMVEDKLLYVDFLRTLPPDKLGQVRRHVYEQFDENEMDKAMERAGVNSPAELDAKLREFGSSLEKQKRHYMERELGRAIVPQRVDLRPEVTHDQMLAYYYEHAAEYQLPAKARFEILSAHFDQFPNKQEAWQAIADWGNQVWLGGAPFSAIARRFSHGFNAQQGGYHDWTTQGALASRVLDEAIFQLEVNSLSDILEDERGFHIVRVLERHPAGRVPFVDVQADIKKQIQKQISNENIKQYLARLREQTIIWTAFDQPQDGPTMR